jgi:hypothetical protein
MFPETIQCPDCGEKHEARGPYPYPGDPLLQRARMTCPETKKEFTICEEIGEFEET